MMSEWLGALQRRRTYACPLGGFIRAALATIIPVLAMGLLGCGSGGSPGGGVSPGSAAFDRLYSFRGDADLTAGKRSDLSFDPAALTARWYTFQGWYVVVFDGLNPDAAHPICLGASVLNAESGQLEHMSLSPTAPGACRDTRNGNRILTAPDAGSRKCASSWVYLSGIPADTAGTLYANAAVFLADDTGVGVTSGFDSRTHPLPEIAASSVNCGPLPRAHELQPPTPTPAPTRFPTPALAAGTASARRAPPPQPRKPAECPSPQPGNLQNIASTAAGPYFVHHPSSAGPKTPTVVFLAGGSGRQSAAERIWNVYFAGRPEADSFRVVLPYAVGGDYIDESSRTVDIVAEVLGCFGGDPAEVHLAGASNGGLAAFSVMMKHPEYFATLLGAPGAFPVQNPKTVDKKVWATALAGRAVFNGVGENDSDWKKEVIETHNALVAAGIESVFVEFPKQSHVANSQFNPARLFEFWSKH